MADKALQFSGHKVLQVVAVEIGIEHEVRIVGDTGDQSLRLGERVQRETMGVIAVDVARQPVQCCGQRLSKRVCLQHGGGVLLRGRERAETVFGHLG